MGVCSKLPPCKGLCRYFRVAASIHNRTYKIVCIKCGQSPCYGMTEEQAVAQASLHNNCTREYNKVLMKIKEDELAGNPG